MQSRKPIARGGSLSEQLAACLAALLFVSVAGAGAAENAAAPSQTKTMVIIDPNPECFYHRNGAPVDFLYMDGGVQLEIERIEGDRAFFTWNGKPAYVRTNFVATLEEFHEENNKRPPEFRFFQTNVAGVVRWVKPKITPEMIAKAKLAAAQAQTNARPVAASSSSEPAKAPVTLAPPPPKAPALSPKETGLAFAKALMEGDAAKAKSFCLPDARGMALLDAQASFIASLNNLNKAVTDKFGAQAAADVKLPTDEILKKIRAEFEGAREEINGDTAMLFSPSDPKNPQKMKLVAGHWKIDLANAVSRKPAEAAAMQQMMQLLTMTFQQLATDIKNGKYANMEEVGKALMSTFQMPKPQ